MKLFAGRTLGWSAGITKNDREEYVKGAFLFFYLFCVVSASTVGRTAADTLFLSRFDASQLSLMYLPQAGVMIASGILFQRFSKRLRIDRLIQLLIPILTSLVLLTRLGVALELRWVFPVMYIGYDVFNFLMIVCFWQFASSVMDQRKAKKMIGLVGSGGIAGGIVSGFGLKLLVPLIGTPNLIFGYGLLQLTALAAVAAVLRRVPDRTETFADDAKKPEGARKNRRAGGRQPGGLFRSVPHLKYVSVLSAALVISLTLIDYQFKVVLRGSLQNDALAGFMGSFYGFSGLLAMLVQLFVAGRVLTRFGVMTAILVFPAALLAGSAGLLAFPVLGMAVAVKGSDKVLGDTIHSSVNQLIMFPIPPEWRNRAKSFLDGIVRNGAKGVAAVLVLVLTPILSAAELGYIVLVLLVVCIVAAIRVKGYYLRLLLSTLETRGGELASDSLDLMDPASRALLVQALASPDSHQSLHALRILRATGAFDLGPHYSQLLNHPSADVTVEALLAAEEAKPPGLEPELLALLDSRSDARVRAQAILTLGAYAKDEFLEVITAKVDSELVEEKASAIAALVKYYGIEGMFRAVSTFKRMLESTLEEERTAMAALFGRIGIREFYKPLVPLLEDESARVRIAAASSAAALRVPELVPHLVPLLDDIEGRRHAVEALASYGEATALPLLEPCFDREKPPLHLPKVYERIGTVRAFEALSDRYAASAPELRDKLLEAMTRMHRGREWAKEENVLSLVRSELASYGEWGALASGFAGRPAFAEMLRSIGQLRASALERIFGLLSLLCDPATVEAVYAGWTEGDARRQANATEVMDQLLRGELRGEIAKLMASPASASISPTSEAGAAPSADALSRLYRSGDEWLRRTIAFAAAKEADEALVSPIRTKLAAEESGLRVPIEELMERISALGGAELFQGLEGRELSAAAELLQAEYCAPGDIVFREGEPGDSLYVVREGRIGIYHGAERVGELGRGECFGQTALLTRRLRSATLKAEGEALLWRLDSAAFYSLMFDRTGIAVEMMKLLSRRIRGKLALADRDEPAAEAPANEQARAEAAATMEERTSPAAPSGRAGDAILRRVLVLRKIGLFSQLEHDDLVRLAHLTTEIDAKPGEALCRAGEFGDTLYGILEGRVRVHQGSQPIAELGEGDCFGEMAIIDSGPRSADCTAVTETVLLRLHRDQVTSFCFQNIAVLRSMMQTLADRLRGMA